MMYSHIVFTGGGLSGLSYIGVIRYIQENGINNSIHGVSGTSVGSMFAALFAMNILAGELEDFFKDYFKHDENTSFSVINSIMSIFDLYGMDDGERLVRPVKHFLSKKYGWTDDTITIRDFVKKTGIHIVICAANITTREPTYFSTDNTPDVCLYDALKASMCIPVLIQPVSIKGELYVDGGICDNRPITEFQKLGQNKMLVIDSSQTNSTDIQTDCFINYVCVILNMLLDNVNKKNKIEQLGKLYDVLVLDKSPIPFLKIKAFDDGSIRITITDNDIDDAVAYGYMKMYELVKSIERNVKPELTSNQQSQMPT